MPKVQSNQTDNSLLNPHIHKIAKHHAVEFIKNNTSPFVMPCIPTPIVPLWGGKQDQHFLMILLN